MVEIGLVTLFLMYIVFFLAGKVARMVFVPSMVKTEAPCRRRLDKRSGSLWIDEG